MMKKLLIATIAYPALTLSLFAQLTLPTVFTSHMVLQREQAVPVWGTAEPNSTITVEFAGQKKTTKSNTDGKWRINLAAMPASSESRELKISSAHQSRIDHLKFSDVLVGEVWLCSGQSNMQMPMQGWLPKCPLTNSKSEIASANYSKIRLYNTPTAFSAKPKKTIDAAWAVCTPDTVKTFSACAYYFGKKLYQDLNVPIGLLESCWGGTRIEPWTPPCGFDGIDSLAAIREQINPMPELGANPGRDRQFPTALYNGMLAAHIPYAIRGAIWYQGEANRSEGMLYLDKTKALLNGWHNLWGYDFPFYFVQIAPFKYGNENPSVLPEFWEAQAQIVQQIPNTGMAVINDVATLNNIHPSDKKDPGERLALLAEAHTYGKNVVSTGPVFKSMQIKGNMIEIQFTSATGLTTRDKKAPDWFEIAGKEGIFKSANAQIKGSSVVLNSPDVPEPLAMRFAWNKLATPNLMNAAGLPVSAFRAGELPKPKAPDLTQIPEMKDYRIVYQLNIPTTANYATAAPQYIVDNHTDTSSFNKTAYLLELQKTGDHLKYVFASMDAFTDNIQQIAVPTVASNARFMQQVKNLTVRSNVDGIIPCTDSEGGNIEFWPGNYSPNNLNNIPGASDKFDFGDALSDKIPGYGCMQVHHWENRQTVFAVNHWGTAGTVDVGIGNSPGERASDWTFIGNAGEYILRRLTVMVK